MYTSTENKIAENNEAANHKKVTCCLLLCTIDQMHDEIKGLKPDRLLLKIYPIIFHASHTLAASPANVAISAPARVYLVFFTFADIKYTDIV